MKVLIMFGLPIEGAAIKYMLKGNTNELICDDQEFLPEEGLKKTAMDRPDLILIHMDGREEAALNFMEEVHGRYPQTGMIALSSKADFFLLQKAIRCGCSDYLLKPCSARMLNDAADRFFESRKSRMPDPEVQREDLAKLKQTLINEMLYSGTTRLEHTADAWLEELYRTCGDRAVQEMIDLTFTIRNLMGWIDGDYRELEEEQKKVIREVNLEFVADLYEAGSEEEARSIFRNYVVKFQNLCVMGSLSNSYMLVEMSKKVIEQELDQKLSLEMVAHEIYISPFYLCRIFKKHTGENFGDYVIRAKIREAKKLLISTNETIDEIAHRVGYDEPNSFRRMFKKRVGVSPGYYRNNVISAPAAAKEK